MTDPPDAVPSDLRRLLAARRQPSWVNPTLATLTDERFTDPAWIFEPKFDGERCLAFRDGYTDPRGSRAGVGALLLGFYDAGELVYAGKVGTGFDEQMLRTLRGELEALERPRPAFGRGALPRSGVHWVEPRLVGQVAFTEWTQDEQLRHPRFQGLRRDKDASDVVKEKPS